MKRYDIYKSEGGYRVAAYVYHDGPVVGASPWFSDKAKAVEYRDKCIRGAIEQLHDMCEEYPKSVIDAEISALCALLQRVEEVAE